MAGKMSKGAGPGDLSINEWNRHCDTAEFVLRNLAFSNGTPKRGTPGDTNFVSVRNGSGADRRQGEILEFTGLELTDLASRDLILTGGNPTLANGFGVLQSPVKDGDYQPDCQIAGGCVGLVNVTDANHKFADVTSGNYVLQSKTSGIVRILWKPSGTGEKTCALLVGTGGVFEIHRGFSNAAINKGATNGSVSRYTDGTDTDSTIDDTITNDFINISAANKKVVYVKIGSTYYLIAVECPP